MKITSSIILKIVLVLTILVFIWSGIKPLDYFTWFLEVVPASVAFVILILTYKKFRFSNFIYILICFHAMILMIGGHTTYAEMPLFNWIRDTFGLDRNYYDRLGHFAQGFVPALIANEILIRKKIISQRGWRIFLIIFTVLGFSAFYEFFEWWMAIGTGDSATAFLGTQGDVWDTQWDMFMCFVGSIVAMFGFFKLHEKKNELEKKRQELIMELAKFMHGKWREARKNEDGSYKPRIRETKDALWIEEHEGNSEVDIANTDFENLPKDWQEENLLSAKVAIEKIEEALYIVHDKWLDRNDQFAEPEQKVQYSRLPKGEQIKDIDILEEAIMIMKGKLQK